MPCFPSPFHGRSMTQLKEVCSSSVNTRLQLHLQPFHYFHRLKDCHQCHYTSSSRILLNDTTIALLLPLRPHLTLKLIQLLIQRQTLVKKLKMDKTLGLLVILCFVLAHPQLQSRLPEHRHLSDSTALLFVWNFPLVVCFLLFLLYLYVLFPLSAA